MNNEDQTKTWGVPMMTEERRVTMLNEKERSAPNCDSVSGAARPISNMPPLEEALYELEEKLNILCQVRINLFGTLGLSQGSFMMAKPEALLKGGSLTLFDRLRRIDEYISHENWELSNLVEVIHQQVGNVKVLQEDGTDERKEPVEGRLR